MHAQHTNPTFKEFISRIFNDWLALVSGGLSVPFTIAALYFNVAGKTAFLVLAFAGILFASYRVWAAERTAGLKRIADLTPEIEDSLLKSAENKRELIRARDLLREMYESSLMWRDVMKDHWALAPESVKLIPDDWPTVLFQAGKISPEARITAESVAAPLSEAQTLILRFLAVDKGIRIDSLPKRTYPLLDKALPALSNLRAEFEAYERRLDAKTNERA